MATTTTTIKIKSYDPKAEEIRWEEVESPFVLGHLACHLEYEFKEMWGISHVPSGYNICWAETEAAATAIVKAIEPLADWDFQSNDQKTPFDSEKVREIVAVFQDLGGFRL